MGRHPVAKASEREADEHLDAAINETQALIRQIQEQAAEFDELCKANGVETVPSLAEIVENENTSPEIKLMATRAMRNIEERLAEEERQLGMEAKRNRSESRPPRRPRRGAMRI